MKTEIELTIKWVEHKWVYTFYISQRLADIIDKVSSKLGKIPFWEHTCRREDINLKGG